MFVMKNTVFKNIFIYNILLFSFVYNYNCELHFPTYNELNTNYNLINILSNGDEWEVVIQYAEYFIDEARLDYIIVNKTSKEMSIMESEYIIQPEQGSLVTPNLMFLTPAKKGTWNVTKYFNYRMQYCPKIGKENAVLIDSFNNESYSIKSYIKIVETDKKNWLCIYEYDEYSLEPMRMFVLMRNNIDVEHKLYMQRTIVDMLLQRKYEKDFIKTINLENSLRVHHECETYVSHTMLRKKVEEIVRQFENDNKYNVVLALLIVIIIIIIMFMLFNFRHVFSKILEKYKRFT